MEALKPSSMHTSRQGQIAESCMHTGTSYAYKYLYHPAWPQSLMFEA